MITRASNFTNAFKDALGHPRDHGCLCVEIKSQGTDQPSLPISALPMALRVFHALGMIPPEDHGLFVVEVVSGRV